MVNLAKKSLAAVLAAAMATPVCLAAVRAETEPPTLRRLIINRFDLLDQLIGRLNDSLDADHDTIVADIGVIKRMVTADDAERNTVDEQKNLEEELWKMHYNAVLKKVEDYLAKVVTQENGFDDNYGTISEASGFDSASIAGATKASALGYIKKSFSLLESALDAHSDAYPAVIGYLDCLYDALVKEETKLVADDFDNAKVLKFYGSTMCPIFYGWNNKTISSDLYTSYKEILLRLNGVDTPGEITVTIGAAG